MTIETLFLARFWMAVKQCKCVSKQFGIWLLEVFRESCAWTCT